MKKLAFALAVLALAAGCKKKEPPPPVEAAQPPEPVKPAPPPPPAKPAKAPELTASQKTQMQADFTAARKLVADGMKFKAEGELLEKTQGRAAANDTLVKAKDKFREACELVEPWVEPELGKVTEAQVKDHLSEYQTELGRWQKLIADLGKLHKD